MTKKKMTKKEKTLHGLRIARNYILEVVDRDGCGQPTGWGASVLEEIDAALEANKPKRNA